MSDGAGTAAEELPAPPREPPFAAYQGLPFLTSLKWLAAGAAAYAVLLLVAVARSPREAFEPIVGPSLWLTPVFGLPLVLATSRLAGRTRRLLYFLLLLPLAHMAANYLAWSHSVANYDPFDSFGEPGRNLVSGALGGAAGAVLALASLQFLGLATRRRAELPAILLAVVALSAIGALGMMQGLAWAGGFASREGGAGPVILWFETVHLPWQLAFALALAWLMRPVRPPRHAPA